MVTADIEPGVSMAIAEPNLGTYRFMIDDSEAGDSLDGAAKIEITQAARDEIRRRIVERVEPGQVPRAVGDSPHGVD